MARAEFRDHLDPPARKALERLATVRRFEPDDTLMRKDDPADQVLVLLEGRVKILVPAPTGVDAVLAFRGPGALIGEQAAVDGRPRSASAVTVEPASALVLPASVFRAYLKETPSATMTLVALLSSRLRDADRKRVEFAAADSLGRVCARLVELVEDYSSDDTQGTEIALPISQDELAGWSGASLESATRGLRQLRGLGWIETGRRSVVVRDLEAVRRRAP